MSACWWSGAEDGLPWRASKEQSSVWHGQGGPRSQEVQHRDGGIITTLAVRRASLSGERQILATLDDVQIKADALNCTRPTCGASRPKSRLIAGRDNLPSIDFPERYIEFLSTSAEAVISGEETSVSGNKLARDSQKEQLERSVSQTAEEINGMVSRLAAKQGNQAGSELSARNYLTYLTRRSSNMPGFIQLTGIGARILGERWRDRGEVLRARRFAPAAIQVQIIAVDQNAGTKRCASFARWRQKFPGWMSVSLQSKTACLPRKYERAGFGLRE